MNPPPPDGSLTSEEIRVQLAAILASSEFASASRASRFLTFVVEQTLAGNHEQIKETVLGIEVFDRSSSFDPKLDTIVRVEAGKLRKRLQQYYETEGTAAPLSIEIPRGTYVPVFQPRRVLSDTPGAPRSHRMQWVLVGLALVAILSGIAFWVIRTRRAEAISGAPSVAVLPFLSLSPDPNNAYFADGLSEELTHVLSKVQGLRVASRT